MYEIENFIFFHGDDSLAQPARAELAKLRNERDAWREFAQHQEWCAVCGDSVADCVIGSELKTKAESFMQAEQDERQR